MKADRDDIVFHPVTDQDLPMLKQWIARRHWQQWWGEPDEEIALIEKMLDGSDSTRPFLFHVGGKAEGYIQYWFVAAERTPDRLKHYPWLAELPDQAVGIDLSIADEGKLSRGIGSTVLARFARQLIAQGHETLTIDPDRDNARAIGAYRKAGFVPVPALEGRTGEVLIMQFDKNAAGKA